MQRVAGVLNILGLIILIFAGLMLFPMAVSCYLDDHAVWSFVVGMAVTAMIGLGMWAFTRKASLGRELRNRDGFLLSALTWMVLPGIAKKWVEKLMAASNMNTMATASIAGESKKPKLASCEENPPRPMIEKV